MFHDTPPASTPEEERRRRSSRQLYAFAGLMVVVVVLVGVLAYLFQPSIGPPLPYTPLSSALELSPASVSHNASSWVETTRALQVNGSLGLSGIVMFVETPAGASVAPPSGAAVELLASSDSTVASYSFSDQRWAPNGTALVPAEGARFVLVWPSTSPTDPLSGYQWVFRGVANYGDNVVVALA